MLKKIIFSLALGIIAALYFAQNDQWVHDAVSCKLKATLQTAWDCQLDFEIDTVNVFMPSVTLKNVRARPKDIRPHISGLPSEALAKDGWRWDANYLTLSSSWITFALSSMVGLHIKVDTADGYTMVQGNNIPLIHDHIMKMVYGASLDIPLYIQSLCFLTSTIRAQHVQSQAEFDFQWSSESKSINGAFKTIAFVHDGNVQIGHKARCNHLQGDVDLNFVSTAQGLKAESFIDCTVDMQTTCSNALSCSIIGSWITDQGSFTIKSIDSSLIVNPIHIAYTPQGLLVDAQVTASLGKIVNVFSEDIGNKVQGDCGIALHSHFTTDDSKIEGICDLRGIKYDRFLLGDDAQLTFSYTPDQLEGLLSLDYKTLGEIEGSWQWDMNKNAGEAILCNKKSLAIAGFEKWMIDARNLVLKTKIDSTNVMNATYSLEAYNTLTHDQVTSQGILGSRDALVCFNGRINRSSYEGSFVIDPSITLKKLIYKNTQGVTQLDLHESKNEATQFQGTIDLGLMRALSKQVLQYDVQGEGHIGLKGSIKDACVNLEMQLNEGLIRLPQTYNFINACQAHIVCDCAQKNITIHDLHVGLYRGSIDSPRIIIQWNDIYDMQYAYAPFIFKSCLFNKQKDFFALFSGSLAINKKKNQLAHAQGSFVIERSYVKENVYSAQFQKNIAGLTYLIVDTDKQDMSCDISIETKEPIRVDTAFLEANAKIALHVGNTVRDPKISGSIELVSGSLAFPYKPLLITKGSIYCMPDQLFDPLIELVAKNKIKNYTVGLHVTGSLLNHHISLQSSPPLTDEQIIALLLVGSQEQSLNMVMPALVMQNLKSIVFDSEQSPLKLTHSFKSWFKPFKNINLVPSFSDQTGRGGLRGAIEIEISDHWRAMAQKNFSLSEDTRFEVEYSLSDDITLRGIRNERKDVATEVEMRWKFGK